MNDEEGKSQTRALQKWQHSRLGRLRTLLPSVSGPKSVTIVAYHFWGDQVFDAQFDFIESSVRETWRHCGLLKTVLVVNRSSRRLEDFAAASSGWVKLDVCSDLVPGSLYSMSADIISRLHSRFGSEYVLIVQNDGFPIRTGLGDFLGEYDYFGAPWVFGKADWFTRLLLRHQSDVGNGGFSLRSRRLCEMTAWYYHRKYKLLPYCYLVTEDFFICKTLPSFEKRYRETIRIAPPELAATFALEDNVSLHASLHAHPFGFHGPTAFGRLLREGLISEIEST
jgi:hypothetical protein